MHPKMERSWSSKIKITMKMNSRIIAQPIGELKIDELETVGICDVGFVQQ